jgi:hypothetical protein
VKSTLLSLFVSLCCVVARAEAEPPELFRKHDFNAAILAAAVNHFQELGEKRAVEELSALAAEHGREKAGQKAMDPALAGREANIDLAVRVAWVCRVLFMPKGNEPLRAPFYGGLNLPYLTMPEKSWPLSPVVASGSSYFVLAESYMLAGKAEPPLRYIEYCRANGVFRTQAIPVPTRAEAQADALALRNSSVWKVLKWTDESTDESQGTSYKIDEGTVLAFINAQADSIKLPPAGQAAAAAAAVAPIVMGIEINWDGLNPATKKKLLAGLRTQIGKPFSDEALEEDMHRVFDERGDNFGGRVFGEPVAGGVKVIFSVRAAQ